MCLAIQMSVFVFSDDELRRSARVRVSDPRY